MEKHYAHEARVIDGIHHPSDLVAMDVYFTGFVPVGQLSAPGASFVPPPPGARPQRPKYLVLCLLVQEAIQGGFTVWDSMCNSSMYLEHLDAKI
ncbi:hypothetical protein ACP70R_039037 [Stipagrostis hirtigluma subsp. patula]